MIMETVTLASGSQDPASSVASTSDDSGTLPKQTKAISTSQVTASLTEIIRSATEKIISKNDIEMNVRGRKSKKERRAKQKEKREEEKRKGEESKEKEKEIRQKMDDQERRMLMVAFHKIIKDSDLKTEIIEEKNTV
jgi:hypothetical protein